MRLKQTIKYCTVGLFFAYSQSVLALTEVSVSAADANPCNQIHQDLESRRWLNPETKSEFTFRRSINGTYDGSFTIKLKDWALYRHSYKLTNTPLRDKDGEIVKRACTITFSYESGDCRGDVNQLFIKKLGRSYSFSELETWGASSWKGDSISRVCGKLPDFLIAPW